MIPDTCTRFHYTKCILIVFLRADVVLYSLSRTQFFSVHLISFWLEAGGPATPVDISSFPVPSPVPYCVKTRTASSCRSRHFLCQVRTTLFSLDFLVGVYTWPDKTEACRRLHLSRTGHTMLERKESIWMLGQNVCMKVYVT